MKRFLCVLVVLVGGMINLPARQEVVVSELLYEPVDSNRQREVPVKVYLRKDAKSPQPVILFSHGLGGSRMNSVYLGKHWAEHGYVAVFMQHHGSDEEVWKSVGIAERMAAMKKAANLKASMDRMDDVPFVIDQLELWNKDESHALFGKLDLENIGMCGHSFGAVTTQAVMGQKFRGGRSAEEPRLDAFLAMSPSEPRMGNAAAAFGEIQKPFIGMTGTEDGNPLEPNSPPASRRKVYEVMPPGDKYELVFDGGVHSTFSDTRREKQSNDGERHHSAIQTISTRFWDAYLKQDASAKSWLQSNRAKEEKGLLIESDIWAWK